MSSDESDILLTVADGLLYNDTYKVSQVFLRCCGGPMYLRQRICELTKVPDASPDTDEIRASTDKSNAAKVQKLLIKSSRSGTVRDIFVKKEQIVTIGSKVVRVSVCRHPTMLGNTCGDCGVTIEEEDEEEGGDASGEGSGHLNLHQQHETVAMLHSMPGLKVSLEEARRLGREDKQHLLDSHKLVLLVDLDQTILHTTNDEPPPNAEDLFHFRLHQLGPVYHTRLRPYTRQFLKTASRLYQLHICTFGVREYAHAIARHLDPNGELFGDRILSRNECLDPMSKKANLKSLFPCGDELVCIIDDRSDVWNFAPNVVQVLPYLFFEQTGDINAPPTGLPDRNRASGEAPDLSDGLLNLGKKKLPKMGRSLQEGGAKQSANLQQPSREATVQQQQRKMMLQQQAAFNSGKVLSCSREQSERLQKAESSLHGSDSNSSSTAYSDVDEVGVNGDTGTVKTGPLEVFKGDEDSGKIEPVNDSAKIKTDETVDCEEVLIGDSDKEPAKKAVSGENNTFSANDECAGETGGSVMETDEVVDDDVTDPSTKGETVNKKMAENKPGVEDVSKDIGSSDGTKLNYDGAAADVEKPASNDSTVDKESTEDANIMGSSCTVQTESVEKTTEKNTDESSVTKPKQDLEGQALSKDLLTETKSSKGGTVQAESVEKTEEKYIDESSIAKPKKNLEGQDLTKDLTVTKPSKVEPTTHEENVEKFDDTKNQNSVIPERDDKLKNGTLSKMPTEEVTKIVDSDDYLLHLEDILKKIHEEFYSQYQPLKPPSQRNNLSGKSKSSGFDKNEPQHVGPCKLPDLKKIVPELRSEVLMGCSIVFSGVVPRGTNLLNSKAYGIATSLGARVCEDLTLPSGDQRPSTAKDSTSLFGKSEVPTTHLVAANLHTVKVKTVRSTKAARESIQLVTPDWLWTCWERWERVDERLYPLTAETEASLRRSPPHHYCAPPPGMFRQQSMDLFLMGDTARKSMMEEVDEQCDSDDSAAGSDASIGKGPADGARGKKRPLEAVNQNSSQTSSSGNDDAEDDSESNSKDATFKTRPSQPEKKRKKLMRKKRKKKLERQFVRNPRRSDGVCGNDDATDGDDSSETDELPSVRIRRGGALESGGEESSSAASDVEALDSGEEERLLRLEQDLMES